MSFFHPHVTLMASVKFVVSSNPLDFFTCMAVKPCLPAYICAVGLWISRQDFTLNSVQFYLMGFGPCSQFVENIFCFHFSIQHINRTSQLWILGNLVVTRPSASSSWSLITLMHRMGWRCRTLIPSWVTSERALQVPLFSYKILQIQIHRNFSALRADCHFGLLNSSTPPFVFVIRQDQAIGSTLYFNATIFNHRNVTSNTFSHDLTPNFTSIDV